MFLQGGPRVGRLAIVQVPLRNFPLMSCSKRADGHVLLFVGRAKKIVPHKAKIRSCLHVEFSPFDPCRYGHRHAFRLRDVVQSLR